MRNALCSSRFASFVEILQVILLLRQGMGGVLGKVFLPAD